MNVTKKAEAAKKASLELLSSTKQQRTSALLAIAEGLREERDLILAANKKDMQHADEVALSGALKDRLLLNASRIESMARAVEDISKQPEVAFQTIEETKRSDGLVITKQRIPLGVVGIIFESRPNVVIDCAALCIKSANATLLKGGKEAQHSNQILIDIVRKAITEYLPEDSVQLIDSKEEAQEMLTLKDLIDVIIPRGGENLIDYVMEHSTIPVIAHYKGLCHMYIDSSADLDKTYEVILNAKCQRPGVCNAIETLIIHKDIPAKFLQRLHEGFLKHETEMRVSPSIREYFPTSVAVLPEDWSTEYLDNIISIIQVKDMQEAIAHIQTFGTHHTEAICSETKNNIEVFLNSIDASCIMVNASTRFNDGGELGLGAEIGISTTKLHAYGPMGAKELTTSRFVVIGKGHIRK
jgi:glutamate-5-semialdehyde dehydrogenase